MLPKIIAKLKSRSDLSNRFGGRPQFFTAWKDHGGGAQTRVLHSPTLRHSRAARRRSRSRVADVARNRFFAVRSWQRHSRPRMAGGGREAREVGRSEERGDRRAGRAPRAGTTFQLSISFSGQAGPLLMEGVFAAALEALSEKTGAASPIPLRRSSDHSGFRPSGRYPSACAPPGAGKVNGQT